MEREQVDKILDFCESELCPVQVTWDNNEYTADFKHMIHARACYDELISQGEVLTLNPPLVEGTASAYYARII